MKNVKVKLGLALFTIGLTGIFSLLSVPVPTLNLPPEVTAQFSESEIRWLILINPAFLLIFAVVFGTLLYDKVKLSVPTIEKAIQGKGVSDYLPVQLKAGIAGGLLAGILLIIVEQLFKPLMPQEFLELGANVQLSPLSRFLYGGFTEEILLRFGLMTVLVWILYKISKRLNSAVYWIAILLSSLLFAAAHLPAVLLAVGGPSPNLILYILIGNSVGGIIFGWLYWRKGLEASFTAHIFTHIVFLIIGRIV